MTSDDATFRLVHDLIDSHLTIATAESLTGGLLCSTLVNIAGASDAVRGGVCTYATELKADILGVDRAHLARTGPVDADVAFQMAQGVRTLMGADIGISTTGVAGPGPADGHEAGTVHIACVTPEGFTQREYHFTDRSRTQVRTAAVDAAITLVSDVVTRGHDEPNRVE